MIKVRFSDTRIEAKGHAGYAAKGKDIVCAGFSSLFYTFVAATGAETERLEDGTDVARATLTRENIIICEAIKKGCELLESNFPDFISVSTLPNESSESV